MIRIKWGPCGALALLLAPVAVSQDLTLDQAVSLALQHNRRIEISKAEIRKAAAAVLAARTYRLPQLSVYSIEGALVNPVTLVFPAGAFGVLPGIGAFPPAPSDVTTPRRMLNVTLAQVAQPLTQQVRVGLNIRAQKLNQQIAGEQLSLEEQKVVNEIKQTFYNILQAQGALTAAEEAIRMFKEIERVVDNALAQQAILKSDALDAQAGLAKAEYEAGTLRDTADTLKEKMNQLMGRELSTPFTVAQELQDKPWDLDLAATRARALEHRSELRQARMKVELAETDRRAKRAEYLPDISLNFDYLGINHVDGFPRNGGIVGLVLQWDVFDWGRKKQELAAKTETVGQAKTAVEEARTQIELEVGLNFRKLQQARQQLKVTDLALQADREKLRVALNKYQENSALLKDVLQMRASVAEKTYKYQETLSSFWNARADLEKAIGEK